jgi:hypothetical protein
MKNSFSSFIQGLLERVFAVKSDPPIQMPTQEPEHVSYPAFVGVLEEIATELGGRPLTITLPQLQRACRAVKIAPPTAKDMYGIGAHSVVINGKRQWKW